MLVRSLYEHHGRAMLAYATHLTRDRSQAEDVVQEALVRAWRHADLLSGENVSVRGWLFTVIRNIVRDMARARKIRPVEVNVSPDVIPLEEDHADSVVDSMVVADGLSRLSDEHRQVLEQMYLRGSTVVQAAKALGIPPGTVKSRAYYAIRALRQMYPNLAGEGQVA
ncbi:sigma-70 family RNA polymerase sigma factor [Phytohabitans flavus]|uniref:RNA polymerase sigma factor SigL n=1 Tax=Phytohabitans flavus TaxID=1076124 RepID=A0A6F8XLI9_9ACTN|nr:hypothetical protein Pflav_010850 [Phytohabitans flavus]